MSYFTKIIIGKGMSDDGCDDGITSPKLDETVVLKEISRLKSINQVTIRVSFRQGEKAQEFKFSCTWIMPRIILQLSSGKIDLTNTYFVVADEKSTCEKVLINLPVMKYLRIDSHTILETKRYKIFGADFSMVRNQTTV